MKQTFHCKRQAEDPLDEQALARESQQLKEEERRKRRLRTFF